MTGLECPNRLVACQPPTATGHGGAKFGMRAEEVETGRIVALKILLPRLSRDPASVERLRREATIAMRLDHPNVIPIYYTGEHEGRLYIVMRYVEGSDLRTAVRAEGRLQSRARQWIVRSVVLELDVVRNGANQNTASARDDLIIQPHRFWKDSGPLRSSTGHELFNQLEACSAFLSRLVDRLAQ